MKYIDAEKLLAEIKIIQQSLESRDVRLNQVKKIRTECLIEFCKCITDVIESLQQEQSEVDLEKEIVEWHKEHFKKDGTFIGKSGFYLTNNSQMDIAKHFFELGLRVNNEKEK